MLSNEILRTFTPLEDEQYTLQVTLQQSRLLAAQDMLDLYSCHSQPHVLEVMEQCELLLTAFTPWLKAVLPGVSASWMRDHLLLSAKLHDIGMCGTEPLRALLVAADKLYTLLTAPGREPDVLLAPYLSTLLEEAPRAHLTSRTWHTLVTLAQDAAANEKQLLASLAAYHEEIKLAIRKQHASNSGRFILAHADAFSSHYGPEVDITAVAVLAALHSSSSLDKAHIVPEGEHYERIRHLIRQMVAGELCEAEADRITADGMFRRLVYLATLLRLADTRRSGSRLMNMDQARMICEVDDAGQITLYRMKNGLREVIPLRVSFDILVSEAMTEFGGVSVYPNSDGSWHVCHEMTLHHAELPHIRSIFAGSRLKTYVNELDTASLDFGLGFTHEIILRLDGCRPFAAAKAAKQWRKDVSWLSDSPLKITVLQGQL